MILHNHFQTDWQTCAGRVIIHDADPRRRKKKEIGQISQQQRKIRYKCRVPGLMRDCGFALPFEVAACNCGDWPYTPQLRQLPRIRKGNVGQEHPA